MFMQGQQRMIVNTALKTEWNGPAIKKLSLEPSGEGEIKGAVNFWHSNKNGAVTESTIVFSIKYEIGDNDDEITILDFTHR